MLNSNTKICVLGLGYVGLPLAIELSKIFDVTGFDISEKRISELSDNFDITNEFSSLELKKCTLKFTSLQEDISDSQIYIITVPTPIDSKKIPDTSMLESASNLVGNYLSRDNIVIYESTVYPGATDEICVPILEAASGLKLNYDFYVGYSPERINPGDKEHKLRNIKKVVSSSDSKSLEIISQIYESIVDAGIHCVSSIRVAEAAKIIENTQRDVNIGLINEFSKIFSILEIDTEEVLKAAETKWNFISFRPGLVGGHCIGVDPYYLTYKAKELGYDPEIILAGRNLNDQMPEYVFKRLILEMERKSIDVSKSNLLILGYTFKENCNDVRNTKINDLYGISSEKLMRVDIFDPFVDTSELNNKSINFLDSIPKNSRKYDAVIIAVAHNQFYEMGLEEIKSVCKANSVIFDLKYMFPKDETDIRL